MNNLQCYMQCSKEAFAILTNNGDGLHCDKEHFCRDYIDTKSFPRAYRWMMQQMKERNIRRPRSTYPLWVWVGHDNAININLIPGQYLVKLLIDSSRILVSDFELWHNVLNRVLISLNEEEYERHKRDQHMIKRSWRYIFDYEEYYANADQYWNPRPIDLLLQGTLYGVDFTEIEGYLKI